MKSTINFYYNLFPDKVMSQNGFFYFWLEDEKYYFVPFNNDERVVEYVYQRLLNEKRKVNEIIRNKDGKIVTLFKNMEYVLLRINCVEDLVVNLEDLYVVRVSDKKAIDWGKVWESKIDYLEYQVSQRGLGKDNILNSFGYYAGLAENAVEYYNMIDLNGASVGIQHKRLYGKNYEINYCNPINMLIDYDVRDIGEYAKFAFFSGDLSENVFFDFVDEMKLSEVMMNLLYVRMLFPTYYFDCYEKLVNEEENENILLNVINKANDFELFLRKFYLRYGREYNLRKIDWLVDVSA